MLAFFLVKIRSLQVMNKLSFVQVYGDELVWFVDQSPYRFLKIYKPINWFFLTQKPDFFGLKTWLFKQDQKDL